MSAASRTDILAPAEFRVGRVFSRSFGIFGRHFFKFFLLALIAMAPSLVFLFSSLSGMSAAGPQTRVQFSGVTVGGGALLWGLLFLLSQAVVLFGTFQDMRGRPFELAASLKAGLSRLLPIIGLGIAMMLALGVGFVLLIVPGFIVLSMLFVSLPACVVERLGPFASMSRSAALTKGHRWRVFGIYLLLTISLTILGVILQAVMGAVLLGLARPSGVVTAGLIMGTVNFAWNSLAGAFQAIIVAVIYHDLRVLKEGVDVEQIAAVFD